MFTHERWLRRRWTRPHEVVLRVAPDNKLEAEDLPLAPWC